VRDKAKSLSAILQDDERFKNERTKALSAKDRYAANTGALVSNVISKVSVECIDVVNRCMSVCIHRL